MGDKNLSMVGKEPVVGFDESGSDGYTFGFAGRRFGWVGELFGLYL